MHAVRHLAAPRSGSMCRQGELHEEPVIFISLNWTQSLQGLAPHSQQITIHGGILTKLSLVREIIYKKKVITTLLYINIK